MEVSLRRFKCSWKSICFQLIFLTLCFKLSSAVDVEWNAVPPVVFGNVTYLQCNISGTTDNCTKIPRQWIGGPDYGSLCYNDECPTSNKYEVMKPSNCLYTLMIYNFSEIDVNSEYTCLYGVTKMRRNLTLDENRFIYVPHVEDIQEETIENGKTFYWKINISKIFPTPSCGVDIEGESNTDRMQISVKKPGFYFATAIQINLQLSSCGIDVYCHLGDYKVSIFSNKNFDSCQYKGGEKRNEHSTMMMGFIITAIILVTAVFCYSWYNYQKEKLCFKKQNYTYRDTLQHIEIENENNIGENKPIHRCMELQHAETVTTTEQTLSTLSS